MQKFAIDTIAFGTLAGYYYLGYAGMQLPIGIMLDKFNFRIVIFFSILLTSLGALAFVASPSFNYLLIGVCGGLMVGALEGFADLWAIPFFKQIYKMTNMESNLVTSCVYIGMCFGSPILAMTANLIKSFNKVIVVTGLLTIMIFVILLYCSSLEFYSGCLLMFLLGIFCCYPGACL
ncbi:MAG: hypothetical protein RCG15_00325 [Candidatus Rickettsia vulgarisii]